MIEWKKIEDGLPKHDCRVLVYIKKERGKAYCLIGNYFNVSPNIYPRCEKVFAVDLSKFDIRLSVYYFHEKNRSREKLLDKGYRPYSCGDLKLTHWAYINKPEEKNG